MAKETRHVHINMTSNMGKTMQNANTSAEKLKGNVGGLSAVANKASGAFQRMGGALSRIGFNPAVLGIGGVVAAIGGLISKASSFEKAASGLQAITGATAEEMNQLKNSALELGASTKFTANEVLQLQTEFSKLGFTVEEIKNVQAATLDLAAAAGVELGEAAEIAGSTLRGFGLDTEETSRVVDVMAKSFTTSALDMDKFRESMKLVAPIAKTTGSSIEESSAALAVLADRGIAGSMAGTQLRRIMSDLAMKTGKDFQTSLVETAEKLENANSKAEKLAIAKELVGDRAKGSLIALAENTEQIGFLTRSYENAEGAAKKMADTQLDNLAGSFTLLKSAFDGFMLSIDDGTGPFSTLARSIVEATTAVLNFLTPLNKQSDAMEEQRTALFGYMAELDQLDGVLANTESSENDVADATFKRKDMIEKLKEQYPDYFGKLDSEKAKTDEIKKALFAVNEEMIKRIAIQKMQEEIDEAAEDQADAALDQAERFVEAQDKANEARKVFRDLGIEIAATDPTEALVEMEKARDEIVQARNQGDYTFDSAATEEMRMQIRNLKNDVTQLNAAQEDLNESTEETSRLTQEMNKVREAMGFTTDEATAPTTDEGTVDDETANGTGGVNAGNDKEKDLRERFLAKIRKLESDHNAKTKIQKLEAKKQEHLEELKKLKMDKTQKGELEAEITRIYDEKIQDEKDARISAFNEKLAGKEANEEMLKLEKQKSDFELELAQLEMDETAKAEAKLRIDAWYQSEKDKIDAATKEAQDKKDADDAARIENERRMRVQMQMEVFDNAARLFGEETALGKAMLVAKQILLAKELVMEAKSSILKAKMKAAESTGEVAKGTAKAAATLNPFVIAGWAITAAGIISTIATAFKSSKDAASAAGASGGGSAPSLGGGGAAPQAPAFNVIGQTSAGDNMIADTINQANANPMRAYVVEGDISSSQELGRKANAMASVG